MLDPSPLPTCPILQTIHFCHHFKSNFYALSFHHPRKPPDLLLPLVLVTDICDMVTPFLPAVPEAGWKSDAGAHRMRTMDRNLRAITMQCTEEITNRDLRAQLRLKPASRMWQELTILCHWLCDHIYPLGWKCFCSLSDLELNKHKRALVFD